MMSTKSDTICMLAVSKAGHDRGKVFVVTGEEGDFLLLADGENRTLAGAKRKNRKHVQPVIHLDEDLREQITNIKGDEDIRRILKAYKQEVMHVEE